MHYPLAAPITSQQLYKGLKCEAKHLSTYACHIIEFCWIEQSSPRILIKGFKYTSACFVLLTTWADSYILAMSYTLRIFLLAYMCLPLWFVDFACRLCCILPDKYFWNISNNTNKINENKNVHAEWLQHACTAVMSDQHKDFVDLQEKKNKLFSISTRAVMNYK